MNQICQTRFDILTLYELNIQAKHFRGMPVTSQCHCIGIVFLPCSDLSQSGDKTLSLVRKITILINWNLTSRFFSPLCNSCNCVPVTFEAQRMITFNYGLFLGEIKIFSQYH